MNLADFISPDVRVARSVNLERDKGKEATLRQYYLTGKGLEILNRFAAALDGERVSAWSLTGPYGMGKSSFVNYFYALCGPANDNETAFARKMIERKDAPFARHFQQLLVKHSPRARGCLRVAVTSSFEPINRTLANGLVRALLDTGRATATTRQSFAELVLSTEHLLSQQVPETKQLVELIKTAGKLYGAPIVIIIDEFGKNLEYMARFPAQGDLFILQALAESEGIYVFVCLHQAFSEYSSRLSARQLQEWGKIQGRFEDISFIEPRSEMVHFICETLARKTANQSLTKAVRSWAECFQKSIAELDLSELKELDLQTIERLYPLHPLTAMVLPELCVRFAQNDRTLFAFLCSGEPSALPAFLSSQPYDPALASLPTFGPELLYDYFLFSSGTALMNRPESHRWIEIHDIIERSRNIAPFDLNVLKVIGLLNLISGPTRFRSSDRMLSFAFLRPHDNAANNDLRGAIAENIMKGVLIYREYADEYRLWEGSDFDIPAAIRERKAQLMTQSLEEMLEHTLPLAPLTASKHSYVTGTLRHFERRWCSLTKLDTQTLTCPSQDVDGLVIYCFGTDHEPLICPSKTQDRRPVVLGYAPCEDQIRELALEAAAIKGVLLDSPEIMRDGVARKEARFRSYMAEERLRSYVMDLFSPGNSEVLWYASGTKQDLMTHGDLSRLLSRCCDETYPHCPVIRNELINRSRLSSAAARARRELMEAMTLRSPEESLGLEGTGPEKAIYRTMLLAEGLHQVGENGVWQFAAPSLDSSYYPAWRSLIEAMEQAGDEKVPVTHLIEALRLPPFGLRDGPIPILLCLFLMLHADDIALYQDGAFIPHFGPEEWELMTKRPEFFTLRRFTLEKARRDLFEVYRSLLNAQVRTEAMQVRNATLIGVVGPLVQFIKNLRPYVIHTRAVSRHAQNIRHELQQARDPVELVFIDLPKALELLPFDDQRTPQDRELVDTFQRRFTDAIVELKEAYPRLIDRIGDIVLRVFGGNVTDAEALRGQLKKRAGPLVAKCGDAGLKPFIAALAGFSGTHKDWLVSLATIATQRPVDSWRDSDLETFSVRVADLATRFSNLETLVAKAEMTLPPASNDRQPRMISFTRSDGSAISNILWVDAAGLDEAKATLGRFLGETQMDKARLQAVFLLLGEHLFSDSQHPLEEPVRDQEE